MSILGEAAKAGEPKKKVTVPKGNGLAEIALVMCLKKYITVTAEAVKRYRRNRACLQGLWIIFAQKGLQAASIDIDSPVLSNRCFFISGFPAPLLPGCVYTAAYSRKDSVISKAIGAGIAYFSRAPHILNAEQIQHLIRSVLSNQERMFFP